MGAVFAARHVQLNERVAIKLLLPEMLDYPEVVERFAREAKAAVRIKSEHVSRVTDVGVLPNGAPYMVMEYLDGTDLRSWVNEEQFIPADRAVEFLLQACEALAEAHSLGIVHRDLKPENLFCVERPDGGLSIKVLDFGISKICHDPAGGVIPKLTQTVGLLGTPLYASPEQIASSRDVDVRSDIWSLGVVIFELLTHRMPFSGAGAIAHYSTMPSVPPPTMLAHRADIPPSLQDVVAKCLGKTPMQRFANVAELAMALSPFAPPQAQRSVERIFGVLGIKWQLEASASPVQSEFSSRQDIPAVQELPHRQVVSVAADASATVQSKPRTVPVLAIAVVAVVLVIAIGGALLFLRGGAKGQQAEVPAVSVPAAAPSVAPVLASQTMPVAPTPLPVLTASAAEPSQKAEPAPPPKAAAPSTPAVKAPTKAKANCNPPFTLDDKGRKHFKPECF